MFVFVSCRVVGRASNSTEEYRPGSLSSIYSSKNQVQESGGLTIRRRSIGEASVSYAASGNYSGAELVEVRPVVVVMVGFGGRERGGSL